MNVEQVLRAVCPRMETSEKIALANALYECGSAEFNHAQRFRLYGNREGGRYHINRWREYVDYAEIVDSMLPSDVRDSIGFKIDRGDL